MAASLLSELAPELRILVQCGLDRSSVQERTIRSCLAEDIDWSLLLSQAQRHCVIPHAHSVLREVAADLVPAPTLARFHGSFSKIATKNLRYAAELSKIVRALNGRQVPVICLKLTTAAGNSARIARRMVCFIVSSPMHPPA